MKIKKNFKRLIGSLLVSVVVFIGLLLVQQNITNPNGAYDVIISTGDIDKGTLITAENVDSFFKQKKDVDGELKVTSAITNKDNLIDKIVNINIEKGAVISENKFLSKDSVLNKIQNSVECSISVNSISQAVGGTLREGDLINISVVNEMSLKNEPKLEKVYVNKVFSSEGKEIKRGDNTATATTINIIISKEDEKFLNEAIAQGLIRISKN